MVPFSSILRVTSLGTIRFKTVKSVRFAAPLKVAELPLGRKLMFPRFWLSLGVQLMVAVELPTVTVSEPGVDLSKVTVPAAGVGLPWNACARARCGASAAAAIARVAHEIRNFCLLRRYAGYTAVNINISMATIGL